VSDVEAYFDESEGGGYFCLAGYIFERKQRIELENHWRRLLETFDVPYFHMKEAGNPKGFRHLTPVWTNQLYRELLALIKTHSAGGYAVSFDLKQSHLLPRASLHGIARVTPYGLCSFFCLNMVRHWVNLNRYTGSVGCFFEEGHRSRSEAHRIMSDIFNELKVAAQYFHGTHRFRRKTEALPLQAADILAWHWRKNVVDRSRGRMTTRADYLSLLEQKDKYFVVHLDGKNMLFLLETISRSQNPSVTTFKITYRTGPFVPYSE
jgi:hypothetical protein